MYMDENKKQKIIAGLFKRLEFIKNNNSEEEIAQFTEIVINELAKMEIKENEDVWKRLEDIAEIE